MPTAAAHVYQDESRLVFEDDVEEPEEVEEEPEELDDEELQETSASEINLHIYSLNLLFAFGKFTTCLFPCCME